MARCKFFVCGLGTLYGFFLAVERTRLGGRTGKAAPWFRHFYAMFVGNDGMGYFPCRYVKDGRQLSSRLFLPSHLPAAQPLARYNIDEVFLGYSHWYFIQRAVMGLDENNLCKAGAGVAGALAPIARVSGAVFENPPDCHAAVRLLCCLAGGTYNPFIYFRF